MSNNKTELLNGMVQINSSDTISQFMEKCNNNFSAISKFGGGPSGEKGDDGSQGVPTKPKVPIHVWKKGDENEYDYETIIDEKNEIFKLDTWNVNLEEDMYQEGHIIILENAHAYILKVDETDDYKLKPQFICALKSFDPTTLIDGKTAHVHFMYLDGEELNENLNLYDKEYIGIYSSNSTVSPIDVKYYTWNKIKDKKNMSVENINSTNISSDTINATNISVENINTDDININNIQNSNFINTLFSKQVTSGANFIVDSLNTKSESNKDNKVVIEGNNIKIISNDGFTSTLITSDEIDFDVFSLDGSGGNYKPVDKIAKCSFDTLFTKVNLKNDSDLSYNEITLKSSYNEIGYILSSNIDIKIIVSISKQDKNKLSYNKWSINNNSIYLLFDTYNINKNCWETFNENIYVKNNWTPCDYLGNILDEETLEEEGRYYMTCDIDLSQSLKESLNSKCCRFKIIIKENGININNDNQNSINNVNILLTSNLNYVINSNNIDNQKEEEKYKNCAIIGKNGMFVRTHDYKYDDQAGVKIYSKNTFQISNNEILMSVGLFGLRIDDSGMYYRSTTNGGRWINLSSILDEIAPK